MYVADDDLAEFGSGDQPLKVLVLGRGQIIGTAQLSIFFFQNGSGLRFDEIHHVTGLIDGAKAFLAEALTRITPGDSSAISLKKWTLSKMSSVNSFFLKVWI